MIRGIREDQSSYFGRTDRGNILLAASFSIVLLAFIGISAAFPSGSLSGPGSYMEKDITFNFEQSVQGTGYHSSYIYAKARNVAMKNYAHGSGSIDSDATLTYQVQTIENRGLYADYEDFMQDCIQFKEDVSMVYAPMRIAVGTGHYAANPLDYSSLIKEKTWAKNYRAGTSMHHEVEYAHAMDKELELVVKDKYNYTHDPVWKGVGYTQMKVNEDVTDGKVHIGVLQANQDFASENPWNEKSPWSMKTDELSMMKSAWKDPVIEIDEDYWGTHHIEKNMTLEVPYYKKTSSEDWLPCCFGGYLTMPESYVGQAKLKSAKGVFDCTCFKAPTEAEFPRTY